MRILVVEDELTNRLLMCELLGVYGTCHVATSGREAIAAVARSLQIGERYELICLDIGLPEVDGRQALKALRALEAEHELYPESGAARVLMVTGSTEKGDVMTAFREQCDGYLVKPVSQARLQAALTKLGIECASPAQRAAAGC